MSPLAITGIVIGVIALVAFIIFIVYLADGWAGVIEFILETIGEIFS